MRTGILGLATVGFVLVLARAANGGDAATQPAPSAQPPRFAAREFNSAIQMGVDIQTDENHPEMTAVVGITPAEKPIEIPACAGWFVRVDSDVDMNQLAQEMQRQHIPGVSFLFPATDADVEKLGGVSLLEILTLDGTNVSDKGFIALIKARAELRILDISGTRIDDAGVAQLGNARLRAFWAHGDKLSDAAMRDLSDQTELRDLDVDGTQVSDAGLGVLARLTNLRSLSLSDTEITDASLMNLKELNRLEELDLSGTQITDAGLAILQSNHGLTDLNLSGTQVTDAGMTNLLRLTNMEHLSVGATELTDAGLAKLKGLTHLKSLDVDLTHVTPGGVADFNRALPNCSVTRHVAPD
jgi:internalin A